MDSAPWRDEGSDDELEQLERSVKAGIVPAVLYNAAGMRHRRPVSRKQLAYVGQAHAAGNVRKIHRNLTRQRNLGPAARRTSQIVMPDAKHLRYGVLNCLAGYCPIASLIAFRQQASGQAAGFTC